MIERHTWDEAETHHAELFAAVAEQRALLPRSVLGVGGRWAGKKTLFDDPRTHPLRDWLASLLPEPCTLHGWGLVLGPGDRITAHNHHKSHLGGYNTWAGSYYLVAPEGSGQLESAGSAPLSPTAGDAAIFPATLEHWVTTHDAQSERIAISFNAKPKG